jgi:RNA polymerase sigma-70 factor (ECF subfamily)
MRRRERALRRFADAGALLAYLHDAGGDRDEKDGIYAVLIDAARAPGPDVEVALALVWLGLWPGLDAIYRRRLRDFIAKPSKPEELVSEIGARFTALVRGADLGRINRVAATLVLNVERDVYEALKRRWADEARRADLPRDDDDDDDEEETCGRREARTSPLLRTRDVSELGQPPRLDPEEDVEALRDLLIGIVGRDADIVLGATVYGLSQREVAERLGLSHEVTRKRYQRAIDRIRRHFEVG